MSTRALVDRERRLHEAERLAQIGSWSFDLATGKVECSPQHLRILGLPEDAPIPPYGELLECVHPDDRDAFLAYALDSLETGRPGQAECRVVLPSGEERWIQSRCLPEYDESGRLAAFYGTTQDVTDRKVVELALARSEADLRDAHEVARLGSWTWDVVEDEARWSDQMYRIHGLQPGARVPTVIAYADLIHPDDRERVLAALGWVLNEHEPYDLEYRIVRPGGEVRWVQARGRPVVDGGMLRMLQGTILDMTERKAVELALAESEQRLREAQAVGHVGSWEWDPVADIASFSEEACRIFGRQPDDPPGTLAQFLDLVHPDDVEGVVETLHRVWESNEEFEGDFRVIRPGGVRWLLARGKTRRDAQGPAVALLGTLLDVTERHEEEERYRAISELVSDAAYSFRVQEDGVAEPEWITNAFARLVECPEEEAFAALARWRELVHPEDHDRIIGSMKNVLAGNDDVCEYRLVTTSGLVKWIQAYAVPIVDEVTGRVTRVFGAARDITEQRRVEEALRRAYEREHAAAERLRATDRLKDEFLSTASHELRTPLTSIVGFASVLSRLRETLDEATRDEIIAKLERNALELGAMVERLLDFSRLQSGSVTLEHRDHPLGSLVRRCLDSHVASPLEAHRVVVDVPDDLVAHIDEAGLVHVLSNLLTNAAKYSPERSTVTVRACLRGDECVVSVTDEGVGMDEETRNQVFHRFFRGSEQPAGVRGTGIGLAIASSYVELMGGRIWVESAPGHGSTFSFAFPRKGAALSGGAEPDGTPGP